MRFACKRLRSNQESGNKTHEEPRLEATLAGFDIRSPREGPSAGVTLQCDTQNPGRLPALRLRVRENLVKAPLATGTSGALPRCVRSALGTRWGDSTSIDATPPSAWRWRARSMTRKRGPPCCIWRRYGSAWRAAPRRRGRTRSERGVSAFSVGLLGEPLPGLRHFLHDLTMPLGLGLASQEVAFLRKSPVFR